MEKLYESWLSKVSRAQKNLISIEKIFKVCNFSNLYTTSILSVIY